MQTTILLPLPDHDSAGVLPGRGHAGPCGRPACGCGRLVPSQDRLPWADHHREAVPAGRPGQPRGRHYLLRTASRSLAKEKIGNVTQVNIEKIVELKPDLVVATSLTERRAVERLKRLGIRVIVFNEPRSYAETNRQFLELGRIVGREREAEEIVRAADRRVDAIKKADRGSPAAEGLYPARRKTSCLPRQRILS